MLEDVMVYGTAKSLKAFNRERPSGGKTGTTDDYRDAWFIGYTPQVITGIWAGYDKPKPGGKGFTGGAVCAPIWEHFMRPALASRPVVDFVKPDTVVTVAIDPATGCRAAPDATGKRDEFFIAGTEPTGTCARQGGAPERPLPLLMPNWTPWRHYSSSRSMAQPSSPAPAGVPLVPVIPVIPAAPPVQPAVH
jgi:membrane carboxypeptidase/penicillin-binding protein